MEQLRADLAVTHNEGAKEERKSKVCAVSSIVTIFYVWSVSDMERNRKNVGSPYIVSTDSGIYQCRLFVFK